MDYLFTISRLDKVDVVKHTTKTRTTKHKDEQGKRIVIPAGTAYTEKVNVCTDEQPLTAASLTAATQAAKALYPHDTIRVQYDSRIHREQAAKAIVYTAVGKAAGIDSISNRDFLANVRMDIYRTDRRTAQYAADAARNREQAESGKTAAIRKAAREKDCDCSGWLEIAKTPHDIAADLYNIAYDVLWQAAPLSLYNYDICRQAYAAVNTYIDSMRKQSIRTVRQDINEYLSILDDDNAIAAKDYDSMIAAVYAPYDRTAADRRYRKAARRIIRKAFSVMTKTQRQCIIAYGKYHTIRAAADELKKSAGTVAENIKRGRMAALRECGCLPNISGFVDIDCDISAYTARRIKSSFIGEQAAEQPHWIGGISVAVEQAEQAEQAAKPIAVFDRTAWEQRQAVKREQAEKDRQAAKAEQAEKDRRLALAKAAAICNRDKRINRIEAVAEKVHANIPAHCKRHDIFIAARRRLVDNYRTACRNAVQYSADILSGRIVPRIDNAIDD